MLANNTSSSRNDWWYCPVHVCEQRAAVDSLPVYAAHSDIEAQLSAVSSSMNSEQHITIQLGNYSNFVGSHLWNFQDEISATDAADEDHTDTYRAQQLYRVGRTRSGRPTCTPRALIVDYRGSLGSLNPQGTVYNDCNDGSVSGGTWSGATQVIEEEPEQKNDFLKMLEREDNYSWDAHQHASNTEVNDEHEVDDTDDVAPIEDSDVRVWSDFLKVHLHPTTVHELPLWPASDPFDLYCSGFMLGQIAPDEREDYFDVIRKMAEDCDHLRCVTVMADLFDGFGGLAASLVQEIRDEMPRITMPIWGFTDDHSPCISNSMDSASSRLKKCNIPLAYAALLGNDMATLMCPLSSTAALHVSPFMDPKESAFHTSAVLASGIEVATGAQRLIDFGSGSSSGNRVHDGGIAQWAAEVTCNHQYNLTTLEACIPFPLKTERNSQDAFAPFWHVLQSSAVDRVHRVATVNPYMSPLSSAVYGSWAGPADRLLAIRTARPSSNIVSCRGIIDPGFSSKLYSQCQSASYGITGMYSRTTKLPIPLSFPRLFRGVCDEGFLDTSYAHCNMGSISKEVFPPISVDAVRAGGGGSTTRDFSGEGERRHCITSAGMAGMGFDSHLVSGHMETIQRAWAERGAASNVQLDKAGLSSDECAEISETLLSLAQRYSE